MHPPPQHRRAAIEPSRAEQWVLHHVVLDRLELADFDDPPPIEGYRTFEKLEAGTYTFTWRERCWLCAELGRYVEARHTPERDRSLARAVLDRLRTTMLDGAGRAVGAPAPAEG